MVEAVEAGQPTGVRCSSLMTLDQPKALSLDLEGLAEHLQDLHLEMLVVLEEIHHSVLISPHMEEAPEVQVTHLLAAVVVDPSLELVR